MNTGTISIKWQTCLIIFIIILGAFLRFYGLGFQSLWIDELFSWDCTRPDNVSEVIKQVISNDAHPPGFHLILHFVQKLGYDSEAALRLPSALCGVFSIAILFFLGRRLFSTKEALIAAALIAVLFRPIYFSQEARPYSMLLLFVLISAYFGIILFGRLDKEGRIFISALIPYIVSASITCYLHYYGVLFVFLQGVGAIIFFSNRKKILPKIILIYLLIVLLYAPWASAGIDQIKEMKTTWIREPKINSILKYLRYIFIRERWLPFLIIIVYSTLFIRSLRGVLKRNSGSKINALMRTPEIILFTWLLAPYIIAFIVSVIFTPVMIFRSLIICLPPAYLLVARFIAILPIKSRNQFVLSFFIISFMLYHLIWKEDYYSKIRKEQFREAVAFIVAHDSMYKNQLFMACIPKAKHLDYYFEKWGSKKNVDLIARKKDDIQEVVHTINKFEPEFLWYMSAHWRPEKEFISFLLSSNTLILQKKFRGAHVWLFRVGKISVESQ